MIIAQMVGRDESDRYLHDVLSHLQKQVDLICFTDDASTDNTYEVAKSFGAEMNRVSKPLFEKNEGKLRSIAWDHLEKFAEEGDWILCIDCDEQLYTPRHFDKLLKQDSFPVLGITFYHMWNETHYRVDKLWAPTLSSRMFRYKPGGYFKDRKLACGSEPTYVQDYIRGGGLLPDSGLRMRHLGYQKDEDKTAKYERYIRLDNGQYHNIDHLRSILDDTPTLVEWQDEL